MDLSEDQKDFLRENADSIPNLIDLTKQCFNDDSLDGRSKEGRAVRKYLVENASYPSCLPSSSYLSHHLIKNPDP